MEQVFLYFRLPGQHYPTLLLFIPIHLFDQGPVNIYTASCRLTIITRSIPGAIRFGGFKYNMTPTIKDFQIHIDYTVTKQFKLIVYSIPVRRKCIWKKSIAFFKFYPYAIRYTTNSKCGCNPGPSSGIYCIGCVRTSITPQVTGITAKTII